MPSITFAEMVNPIAPFAPGCPSLTLENTARKIAKDLCQRATVWRGFLAPIPLTVNQYAYTPVTGLSYGELNDVIDAYVVINNQKTDVQWQAYADVRRSAPAWPQDYTGTPARITSVQPGEIQLVPVPDTVGTLTIYGSMRPADTDSQFDRATYNEFSRAIFHGVLAEILGMPQRSWTDMKAAGLHGKQWTYLLNAARDRAMRGYNQADLAVVMRPFA